MSEEPEQTELPELTVQQFKFVQGLLEGQNASDAYRAAYDCKNMSNEVIWKEASILKHHRKVTVWLSKARTEALMDAKVTIEGHTAELERLKALALDNGNYGAAIKAEELRGKANGLYIEKHEDVSKPKDPAEIMQEIERHSPEFARMLRETETKH